MVAASKPKVCFPCLHLDVTYVSDSREMFLLMHLQAKPRPVSLRKRYRYPLLSNDSLLAYDVHITQSVIRPLELLKTSQYNGMDSNKAISSMLSPRVLNKFLQSGLAGEVMDLG